MRIRRFGLFHGCSLPQYGTSHTNVADVNAMKLGQGEQRHQRWPYADARDGTARTAAHLGSTRADAR
jgi:hypothetical protein